MTETRLCKGKVSLRPNAKGNFNELVASGQIHMEVIDDNTLWIAICPTKHGSGCVHVTISSKAKLDVSVQEA